MVIFHSCVTNYQMVNDVSIFFWGVPYVSQNTRSCTLAGELGELGELAAAA